MYFLDSLKERNKRCLEDVVQMDQVLKSSFLCLLLDWVRVDLNEATMSMIDLINWLGVCRFFFFFFLPFLCFHFALDFDAFAYDLYMLAHFFMVLLIYLFACL